MSNFLCKSETLSLIAEKLAQRAETLGAPHAGDVEYFFKKVLKMNQIASGENCGRVYMQQCGYRYISKFDIVAACRAYEYQTSGKFTRGTHTFDFENNAIMKHIRAIGYNAAVLALQNAASKEMIKSDKEFWG